MEMGGNEWRRLKMEMDRKGGWQKGGVCVCVASGGGGGGGRSVEYEDDFYH